MDEKSITSVRLDVYLFENGMCQSRALAKKLILDSSVLINGVTVTKPSTVVQADDKVTLCENKLSRYVSRGALKLEAALDEFDICVEGYTCIDIGASTGGFTDLLIQRGASLVYAVENGNGQLHERLLNDKRVVSLENTNARTLTCDMIPVCDIAVMDVSFVSQTLFYKTVSELLRKDGLFVSLIKPQFEAGREHLNKKGIVRDVKVHKRVIEKITNEAALYGFKALGIIPSPIEGGDGNKEYLVAFTYKGKE
ncbi:MAG: TlyA family RNA methyltransferase [Clostridia bacterium]|nr:TlyA family RNA methyltransferase [Clostridia bacterium]